MSRRYSTIATTRTCECILLRQLLKWVFLEAGGIDGHDEIVRFMMDYFEQTWFYYERKLRAAVWRFREVPAPFFQTQTARTHLEHVLQYALDFVTDSELYNSAKRRRILKLDLPHDARPRYYFEATYDHVRDVWEVRELRRQEG